MTPARWLAVVCAACLLAGWLTADWLRRGLGRGWRAVRHRRETRCVRCGAPVRGCRCGLLRDEHTRRNWWRRDYGQR